jgi:hypothetical protein
VTETVTEIVTGTLPNVTELVQTRPCWNGPAKPDCSAVSAGYAANSGGIPAFSDAGRPDSRSGRLLERGLILPVLRIAGVDILAEVLS